MKKVINLKKKIVYEKIYDFKNMSIPDIEKAILELRAETEAIIKEQRILKKKQRILKKRAPKK